MTVIERAFAIMPMLASSMTVEEIEHLTGLFNILSIVAFCIAGLAAAGSVFIWIKLDIKNVIGFLSGKNAAKAIEALLSGKQVYRGKSMGVRPADPAPRAGTAYSGGAEATMPLQDSERTELLSRSARGSPSGIGSRSNEEETELLDSRRSDETELLDSHRSDETELLDRRAPAACDQVPHRRTRDHYDGGDEELTAMFSPDAEPAAGQPRPESSRNNPAGGFHCDETQILTDVWDEEIKIDL